MMPMCWCQARCGRILSIIVACAARVISIPRPSSRRCRLPVTGVHGVEILSEKHRKLPLDEMARRSFDTTMAQFKKLAA